VMVKTDQLSKFVVFPVLLLKCYEDFP